MIPNTVQKFGKFGRIICTILQVFVMIGIVCTLIAALTLTVMPDQFITIKADQTVTTRVDMRSLGTDWKEIAPYIAESSGYETDENGIFLTERGESTLSNRQLAAVMFPTSLTLMLVYALLIFLRRFSSALYKSATPFVIEAEKNLRASGIAVILLGCVPAFLYMIFSFVSGVRGNAASGLNISADLNLGYICIGVGLIGLSYVFAYGRLLQEKSGGLNPSAGTGDSDSSAQNFENDIPPKMPQQPSEKSDSSDSDFHPDAF